MRFLSVGTTMLLWPSLTTPRLQKQLKVSLMWYYDQIFTPWLFRLSHRISWKNNNTIYHLQTSVLHVVVPEILKVALTTVLMEYIRAQLLTLLKKVSRCFSLHYLVFAQVFYHSIWNLNNYVNKWPKWATGYPTRDWALVG